MLKRILVVMIVLLVLSALFAMTVAAQGTGDPAAGKTAWAQRACKSCHGTDGEGKYAAPLAGTTRTSAEWIVQVHTPRANMPAFSTAQISDTVITDMWAYMKTLTKPASFTPVTTTVPAGALPGHQLTVDKRCVACHGDFKAFVKARFVDQNREVTTDAVLKQLRTPAKNMPMFDATHVTDAQAAQIADFIKAQAVAVKAAAVVTPTTPVTATKPVTATAVVTATKATTTTAAAVAAAPVTMPKTGANLSLSAQVTTTTPVTATKPVTATAPVTATKPVTTTAVVTATKAATTTAAAAAAAPAPAPATMPKTGGEMGLLVLSGLSLLGISAGLAIRGRRR
jgi:LPXTG-motif cell wall-anchored protein